MPVKLSSSGGGSVTLDTPSTASNLTVTLPSASGTLATTSGSLSSPTITGTVAGGATYTSPTLTGASITAANSNTVEATSGPTSTQLAGQRNKIINGAMMIDQRNAGASNTTSVLQTTTYMVDRWAYYVDATGKFNWGKNLGSVSPPVGFTSYLGFSSTSAYTISTYAGQFFSQRVEGYNISDLGWGSANAKTATLSFWVYSSLTGLFGGVIASGDSSQQYPFGYTINAANTWQQITIVIPGPTSGGTTAYPVTSTTGLVVTFSLGAGGGYVSSTPNVWSTGTNYVTISGATQVCSTNGATFYITGVQLEKGATATPFENRLYGTELALCKRYYQKSVEYGTTPGTGSGIYTQGAYYLVINSGTSESMQNTFECELRAVPSMAIWSSNNSQANYAWSEITQNNLAFSISGTTSKRLGFGSNPTGSGISGNGYYVTWTASAEL